MKRPPCGRSCLRRRLARRCSLISPDPGTPPARVGGVPGVTARAGMATSWEATITPADIARCERVAVAEAIVSAAMMSAVVAHSFDALGINALDGKRRG